MFDTALPSPQRRLEPQGLVALVHLSSFFFCRNEFVFTKEEWTSCAGRVSPSINSVAAQHYPTLCAMPSTA